MTFLYHLFPPTIHPMVIHFTIAIIYLTTLAGITGLIFKKDKFYTRAFFILIGLSILATMAAGVAGVISEFYLTTIPHGVNAMLHAHKRDGELTGVLLVVAFAAQWMGYRKGRVSLAAFAFCVLATAMVSVTGFIGGSMVYDHGLGVH
ncbi:DUF2231 domain-containing protein [Alicyclobacillus tolerans]|uniref:DUF2231 domain-containing protein n=1 Tax=Alicyclobacillus tolerans TaxID=90970 RepID=UPI001F1C7686|nr:DUF2231 domain-containing protein [Alicyclobacillus tolerans]MCF8565796.1 DUF2231 domain-containing protein [Alicyclobacillus tolerans]